MPALTMRGPRGLRLSLGKGYWRSSPETWAVSALVDGLLDYGFPGTAIFPEYSLTRRDRPDLVAFGDGAVLIFEAKSTRPTRAYRRQVRRYMDAARNVWPDSRVIGFLAWPTDERALVSSVTELTLEQVES